MAEDEIIKHTKKAYGIFKSSTMDWQEKIKEIITEILIIIFAVSVSIGLHNWSETRHERQEAKEFLTGFKQDLQIDMKNMENSKKFYLNTVNGIRYFLKASAMGTLTQDSVVKYSEIFFSSTDLDPHIARYEGLKSSGKFKVIENKELLNNIIDLQETIIQRIQALNEKYYQNNEKLETLIDQNVILGPKGEITNAETVLKRSDIKILLNKSGGLIANNIIAVHDSGIAKCKEIIKQIEEENK